MTKTDRRTFLQRVAVGGGALALAGNILEAADWKKQIGLELYTVRDLMAKDLEGTLAGVPALVKAGASLVELFPSAFCRGPEDFEAFCARILRLKEL